MAVRIDDGNYSGLPKGTVARYGYLFPPGTADWTIELYSYKHGSLDGTSREENFRLAASMIFTKKTSPFIWHPWAEDMLHECCTSKYVGFAGCGSSGKSDFMAVWTMLNWLASPFDTLCLLTSTTIRDAQKRVWGAVLRYWPAISGVAPGKITATPTPEIYTIHNGSRLKNSGLYLIPAEAKKTNEVTGKMRGMKANRVFLAADELSELSHGLLDTAISNLSVNPFLHICAAANPTSHYDPFGKFAEPKDGWNSITVNDKKWTTKLGGTCLHFDALANPNYLASENLWPIQKWEKIEEARTRLGDDSPLFWRDFRGFWAPQGTSTMIYSESEILRYEADQPPMWMRQPTRVAGIDPSFVSGGDRCVLYVGSYGENRNGAEQVSFDTFHYIEDDAGNMEPRTFQVARKIKEILDRENVDYYYVGVDVTGGGVPFCDALATVLGSNDFFRVHFGGSATERSVSMYDSTKASEKYANRVTELWFGAKELLQNGQIRGIGPDLAREMTARNYETKKSGSMKVLVESKREMKSRTGKSPDIADAAFILLDAVRERFGFRAHQQEGGGFRPNQSWKAVIQKRYSPRRSITLNY